MAIADERIHGTTHEAPRVRFGRDERDALRPLPVHAIPHREHVCGNRDEVLSQELAHELTFQKDEQGSGIGVVVKSGAAPEMTLKKIK